MAAMIFNHSYDVVDEFPKGSHSLTDVRNLTLTPQSLLFFLICLISNILSFIFFVSNKTTGLEFCFIKPHTDFTLNFT